MTEQYYIGFRIEIASRMVPEDIDKRVKKFNRSSQSKIFGLQTNGKIGVSKSAGMVIACGNPEKRKLARHSALINFAIMIPIKEQDEIERLIQIINVLGNGRLIRERIKTFIDGGSVLSQLPELQLLVVAFERVEKYIPGLIRGGWYYAPEAIL